jgi:hypothetical protein
MLLSPFDLSVSTADYLQPFPSVVIELLADYTRKIVVSFENGNCNDMDEGGAIHACT